MQTNSSIQNIKPDNQKVTHGLLYSRLTANLGLVVYGAAIWAFHTIYKPIAPAQTLQLWFNWSIAIISIIVLQNLLIIFRNPTLDELTKFWRPIDKVAGLLLDFIVIGVIILLFPHANEDAKLITVVILIGYIPTAILADPENSSIIKFSVVLILGSLTSALLYQGGQTNYILSTLIFVYGVAMFASSGTIRKTVLLAVERRTESEQAKAALEIAMAQVAAERDAKTRFIAAASHDLGQPLQAANLFFEQAISAPNESLRERAANGARRAFLSAQSLIGHMLTHLRLEADAVIPINAKINCAEIIESVRQQNLHAAFAQNISLKARSPQITLFADRSLLERVLNNLVTNAINHSKGTKILIAARQRHENEIWFEVIDNGTGIPPIEQAKIFDDYFQSQNTINSGQNSGFGLGLSSAKRIANVMGGSIELLQGWKNGAYFRLKLPIVSKMD